MQRQSLGSPAAKHLPPPIHGVGDDDDDGKRKRKKRVVGGAGVPEIDEAGKDDEVKPERPFRRSSGSGAAASASASAAAVNAERSIHLIPVLTLLCFLVLYLCSHDPSATDMADLGGGGRLFGHTASRAEIGRYAAGSGGGGVATAVRSHRSLKELQRIRGHHSGGRKLGRRTE